MNKWFLLFILVAIFVQGACDKDQSTNVRDEVIPETMANAERLTTEINDLRPKWSSTGDKIVFERNYFIYTLDVASGALTYITEGQNPCWAPKGDRIAFIKNEEIHVVRDIPERPVEKLTFGAHASYMSGCDWGSRNRIAYFQSADSLASDRYLVIYYIDSNTFDTILFENLGFCEMPSWSMDGRRILFHSQNQGICYIDMTDESLHQIARWGIFHAPCWYTGVDSTFILYTQTGQLHMVDLDGKEDRVQLGDDFNTGSLSYNRTKRKLTFNYHGIWIMDFYPEIEKAMPDIEP